MKAITEMTNEFIGKRVGKRFDCVYSEAGYSTFLKTLLKEDDVIQLQNLAITNLPNNKDQKVKCTDKTNGGEYLYLGYINGTFSLDKQFNVKDPHFYLHQNWGKTYNIDAVGKFYPCSKEAIDEDNAFFHSTNSKITILKVLKNIQFGASWPQTSMSDHGNPIKHSWIHAVEYYMRLSDNQEWITLLEGPSKVNTNLRDKELTFRWNSTSRPHKARGTWVIQRNEWQVEFNVPGSQWRPFFEDFFPRKMPLQGFEIEKLGKALPSIISGGLEVSV